MTILKDAVVLIRGHLLQVAHDQDRFRAVEEPDGALLLDASGRIVGKGSFKDFLAAYPALPVKDYTGSFILPSFIDTHIHFPQLRISKSSIPKPVRF